MNLWRSSKYGHRRVLGGCLISLTMALAMRASAQTAALSITAPVSGTTVTPGAAVAVTVSVASGSYPSGIAIIAQDPLGSSPLTSVSGPTINLILTIPSTAPPGSYALTAAGANSTGALVSSAPIQIDVERADLPTALSVDPLALTLRFVGDALPFTVIGSFNGGIQKDVTQSSRLTMQSANPSVATAQSGAITAVGAGQTTISLTYGLQTVQIVVTVPPAIRGDLNGDGVIDKSDLNIITAALNSPANGASDARDLNHDGLINALDARILVTLCTHPACASQ